MNYLIFDYSDYIEKSLGSFLLGSNVIHESSKKHRRIKSLGYMLLDVMPKRILDKMVDYMLELWLKASGASMSSGRTTIVVYECNPICRRFNMLSAVKRRLPGAKVVFMFTNLISEANIKLLRMVKSNSDVIDAVYTFDDGDAERHGLGLYDFAYSPIDDNSTTLQRFEYDLYFCGYDKGRLEKLISLYDAAVQHGVKCVFDIVCPSTNVSREGIMLRDKPLTASEMLLRLSHSKCVLDISARSGSSGLSLRTFEALSGGKKLATDNPNIIGREWFNEEQIQVVKALDLIDWDFFKSPIAPNDAIPSSTFSSERLFEKISEDLFMDGELAHE